jgi:hypothetical protein
MRILLTRELSLLPDIKRDRMNTGCGMRRRNIERPKRCMRQAVSRILSTVLTKVA